MKTMTNLEVNKYVKSHGLMLPNRQVFIKKPLYAFKNVDTYGRELDAIAISSGAVLEASFRDGRDLTPAIANLVIPKGAIVNLTDYDIVGKSTQISSKKLRASMALCWNIIRLNDRKETRLARSRHDIDFEYRSCKNLVSAQEFELLKGYPRWFNKDYILRPDNLFDMSTGTCASGIHFFVETIDAINY